MPVHVMLDLETWGTAPGSALRSIGAVTFNPRDDEDQREFYANIERESCEAAGLKVDPATVVWWERQSIAAQDALFTDPRPLRAVAVEFCEWWSRSVATFLWSNGANFDEVLWRVACEAVGVRVPWKYWNVRDTRTIWDAAGVNPRMIPRSGTAHNALADARHQAQCVTLAYRKLGLSLSLPSMALPASGPGDIQSKTT